MRAELRYSRPLCPPATHPQLPRSIGWGEHWPAQGAFRGPDVGSGPMTAQDRGGVPPAWPIHTRRSSRSSGIVVASHVSVSSSASLLAFQPIHPLGVVGVLELLGRPTEEARSQKLALRRVSEVLRPKATNDRFRPLHPLTSLTKTSPRLLCLRLPAQADILLRQTKPTGGELVDLATAGGRADRANIDPDSEPIPPHLILLPRDQIQVLCGLCRVYMVRLPHHDSIPRALPSNVALHLRLELSCVRPARRFRKEKGCFGHGLHPAPRAAVWTRTAPCRPQRLHDHVRYKVCCQTRTQGTARAV
jgi:hypothetical protein